MSIFHFLNEFDYFVGVPDSFLAPVVDCIMKEYGVGAKHTICANEGNAVGMAAGYHLATGKVPVVYLQNSGIGNIINPVTSLLREEVYGIPCFFLVGWRGQPGLKDEPQHLYQGKKTVAQLEASGVICYTLKENTLTSWSEHQFREISLLLKQGKQVALIVQKGAIPSLASHKMVYENPYPWKREEVLTLLLEEIHQFEAQGVKSVLVSTTGKTSRELYELRGLRGESHEKDFLTVGSMGHASSIALALAVEQPNTLVWCLDGDGACLMHLGAMAVIGQKKPKNLIHVLLNNEAHESVGGAPTVSGTCDWGMIAQGCGYPRTFAPKTQEEVTEVFAQLGKDKGLCFLELKTAIGSRENLGRPKELPVENKMLFMEYLQKETDEMR